MCSRCLCLSVSCYNILTLKLPAVIITCLLNLDKLFFTPSVVFGHYLQWKSYIVNGFTLQCSLVLHCSAVWFYSAVQFGCTVQYSLVVQCSTVWLYSAVKFGCSVQFAFSVQYSFGFTVHYSLVLQGIAVWVYRAVQFSFTVQCNLVLQCSLILHYSAIGFTEQFSLVLQSSAVWCYSALQFGATLQCLVPKVEWEAVVFLEQSDLGLHCLLRLICLRLSILCILDDKMQKET